jgi:HSP20 family protein
MKNNKRVYITGLVAAFVMALVVVPLYAENKNSGKVNVVNDDKTRQAAAPVVAQSTCCTPFADDYDGWDPFADFIRMRQEMNNMLNSTFNHYQANPGIDSAWTKVVMAPACDIQLKDNKYTISLDLPGMEKSDIKIKIDGDILSISGQRSAKVEKKDGDKFILRERTMGSFERAIRLPREAKKDKVDASYNNGTLTITIPMDKKKDTSVEVPIK